MSIQPNQQDFAIIAHQRQVLYHDLEAAKKLIQRGWCQNRSSRCRGLVFKATQYCLTGAIAKAANDDLDRAIRMVHALHGAVFQGNSPGAFEDAVMDLQGWNDRNYRTQEDMVAAFDKALADIRAA